MASTDGRAMLVFNGEIYNYRELRAELMAQGVRFHTDGDSEVILAAYQRWGVSGWSACRACSPLRFTIWTGANCCWRATGWG
jgi:asparagine synthetase B (glutamine-hydrolysing)